MRADEAHQQELDHQKYMHDMDKASGVSDFGRCDGCIGLTEQRVTTWSNEGFAIRYGKEAADTILKAPLPLNSICTDGKKEDIGQVRLCHECEWHPERWSEL